METSEAEEGQAGMWLRARKGKRTMCLTGVAWLARWSRVTVEMWSHGGARVLRNFIGNLSESAISSERHKLTGYMHKH